MNRKIKLILLVFVLSLNFSCTENKSIEKVKSEPELVVTPKTDTLKFTSGIRAILREKHQTSARKLTRAIMNIYELQ